MLDSIEAAHPKARYAVTPLAKWAAIGKRLQQYLAAHDLTADRAAFQPINKVVGAGLLAGANEFACDLLVMGAYSHSRLRQFILGGVTRHVLEHATVPLLMHR